MTTIDARITECRATAHQGASVTRYTAALTVQISAGDLTRIDITRPITIHQENPDD